MYEADRGITPLTINKPHTPYLPAERAGEISAMIVDDNRLVLEVLSENLIHYGFKVTLADDAFEALDFLDRESFQMVITDFQMPGMDGLALATIIKKRYPAMIVILTSGMDRAYLEGKQELKDIDFFFPKPFDMKLFLSTVGGILKQ